MIAIVIAPLAKAAHRVYALRAQIVLNQPHPLRTVRRVNYVAVRDLDDFADQDLVVGSHHTYALAVGDDTLHEPFALQRLVGGRRDLADVGGGAGRRVVRRRVALHEDTV